jgi:hypothetical protein
MCLGACLGTDVCGECRLCGDVTMSSSALSSSGSKQLFVNNWTDESHESRASEFICNVKHVFGSKNMRNTNNENIK